VVSQKFIEKQPQILRLTTPRLKSTPGAPFAQDDELLRVVLSHPFRKEREMDGARGIIVPRISDSGR